MTYSLEFELPGLPHCNPADNRHWRTIQKEKKEWIQAVFFAVHGKRPEEPLQHARVVFTRFSSVEPDCDNLPYSFKRIRDSLCKKTKKNPGGCDVLEDDDPTHLEAIYQWEKAPPRYGRVRVRVESRED